MVKVSPFCLKDSRSGREAAQRVLAAVPAGAERPAGSFRIRKVVDVGEYRRGKVKRNYRLARASRVSVWNVLGDEAT